MTVADNNIRLDDRGILISGGLGALGGAIVNTLTAAGARVVINDIKPEDQLCELPHSVEGYIQGDASTAGQTTLLVDRCTEILGRLPDVVCCHAGIVRSAPILEHTAQDLEDMLRTNVIAQFSLAQEVSRRWVAENKPGHLIFTSSWVQDIPWPGIAGYIATKSALKAIARSFARELAPYGIRANILAPGIVAAGMAQHQWDTEPDYRTRTSRAIPLRKMQDPQSVADAFLFLASDSASYMTGSTLLVDGGASLYPMDETEH
ncbi:SDR family NAD(P)-dependent oxidoreductase [Arthrobacter tumbae]|uniref:SDR family NAD(P)-dependent oxidoreductase n=1 Tax=Arthrobacter tumbae TaxID=163874 RepID=UPI00195B38A3|nr:SDR family oxidoreductase [Arthrobacter tumbae]MBM7781758.1 NAD(P)-dependent dehydrogenase (short-subunit alcohol dehydrogenase family) [Arthrobacter tumbae]